jgi:ATP-dependent helicase/DNAse subunit B
LVIVDGFDDFSEVLLAILEGLDGRVDELIITLTKESTGPQGARQPFKLFQSTLDKLEGRLGAKAEPLPDQEAMGLSTVPAADLQFGLEQNLFRDAGTEKFKSDGLTMIACPDRSAEVRAALRWIKERIVFDSTAPQDVALLARNIAVYEPFIRQTASEFKLPVHLSSQKPLGTNPAIVSIIKLLELHLPISDDDPDPALPRQGVVDAWRSTYFDWGEAPVFAETAGKLAITAEDADDLDDLARNGRIIGGLKQWEELSPFRRIRELVEQGTLNADAELADEERLAFKFTLFRSALRPPEGQHNIRVFVEWLDGLLGSNPGDLDEGQTGTKSFLQLSNPELSTDPTVFHRDLKALRELKDIFRGMISVEEKVSSSPITYEQFFGDLIGMIEASSYSLPEWQRGEKIFVADVVQARGLGFKAAAILGLSEGEFPQTYMEDPLLWESDRIRLNQSNDIHLESTIESKEREYFYQAVTLPREALLLTRPRLADSGAEWQPSPYWEEVLRLFDVEPLHLTTDSIPAPDEAASLSELVESLVAYPNCRLAQRHLEENEDGRYQKLQDAVTCFDLRFSRARTPLNGDLTAWAKIFGKHFDAGYGWSASSLETYHGCPYRFFIGKVLYLQPRLEPAEGMDVAQRGTIYHQILEQLYKSATVEERTDPEKLLSLLPSIADRILDAAPEQQEFRETAWWRETRKEIRENVARTVQALVEIQGDFIPSEFELHFSGRQPLIVYEGADSFRLSGYIDRVDIDDRGRARIIDYKTGGPAKYSKQTLESGEKIQLALYALAARDTFGHSEIADGFYWHVFTSEPSKLRLSEYGVDEAISAAVGHAWLIVRSARQGHFVPQAPADGCPEYCPAVAFCWNYRPGRWA